MFVLESLEIKRPRHLSAQNKAHNAASIKRIKANWDTFDYATRIRAAKTIRCLETQEAYR